jgi:hypothetical protein
MEPYNRAERISTIIPRVMEAIRKAHERKSA